MFWWPIADEFSRIEYCFSIPSRVTNLMDSKSSAMRTGIVAEEHAAVRSKKDVAPQLGTGLHPQRTIGIGRNCSFDHQVRLVVTDVHAATSAYLKLTCVTRHEVRGMPG
jgi:hypothetical protein